MTLRQTLPALMCALLLLASSGYAADENQKAATEAAERWLAVVDAGNYVDSWDQAADIFQQNVTRDDWVKALQGVRAPLGALKSRDFKSAEYETKLPHAPEGKYFILQYRSSFANAPGMIETVVPMQDSKGQWKVSGYFIKPGDE